MCSALSGDNTGAPFPAKSWILVHKREYVCPDYIMTTGTGLEIGKFSLFCLERGLTKSHSSQMCQFLWQQIWELVHQKGWHVWDPKLCLSEGQPQNETEMNCLGSSDLKHGLPHAGAQCSELVGVLVDELVQCAEGRMNYVHGEEGDQVGAVGGEDDRAEEPPERQHGSQRRGQWEHVCTWRFWIIYRPFTKKGSSSPRVRGATQGSRKTHFCSKHTKPIFGFPSKFPVLWRKKTRTGAQKISLMCFWVFGRSATTNQARPEALHMFTVDSVLCLVSTFVTCFFCSFSSNLSQWRHLGNFAVQFLRVYLVRAMHQSSTRHCSWCLSNPVWPLPSWEWGQFWQTPRSPRRWRQSKSKWRSTLASCKVSGKCWTEMKTEIWWLNSKWPPPSSEAGVRISFVVLYLRVGTWFLVQGTGVFRIKRHSEINHLLPVSQHSQRGNVKVCNLYENPGEGTTAGWVKC